MISKHEDKMSNSSEGTESTDLDVSFQTLQMSSRTDCITGDSAVFTEMPMVPLKHRVTIGSTDTKEIQSLMKSGDEGSKADEEVGRRLSDQRVSEIFLRERFMSLYSTNTKDSKKSLFFDDLQALFDTDELQETLEEDKQEEAAASTPSKRTPAVSIKTCTFGGVEIREFPIIPGDSPAGFKGPPLTIDWKPVSAVRVSVEKYERARNGHRRNKKEMTMPAAHREAVLRNQGFTETEIKKCIKDANHGRRQRKDSMSTLKHQASLEKIESIRRTTINILTFGQHNKAQKEYLKKYVPFYGVAPTSMPVQ